MNWKEIEKKYPKGFDKFFRRKWKDEKIEFSKNGSLYFFQRIGDKSYSESEITFKGQCELRMFYDFFDEHEIYICIDYLGEGLSDCSGFTFTIKGKYCKDKPLILAEDYREEGITRKETEEQAFLKAFEILEKQLK